MSAEQQFSDFARTQMSHLYRAAWLLCGDTAEAERLTRAALAEVYADWGRRVDDPASYALTMLVRAWFASQRKRRRSGPRHEPLGRVSISGVDRDVRTALAAALNELEPFERAVLVLRVLDGVPADEVATIIGMTSGGVETRAAEALDRVRTSLGASRPDLSVN